MFPLKNTEAYIHANGFRSTLGKELADRDAAISELGSEIQALSNYVADTGVKNLLPNTLINETKNGITFTHNTDGTVGAIGTLTEGQTYATQRTYEDPTNNLPTGVYHLSGWPSGIDGHLNIWGSGFDLTDTGNGVDVTLTNGSRFYVAIVVKQSVPSGITIKPMLTLKTTPDSDYAHYQPYAKTNVELTQDVSDVLPIVGDAIEITTTESFANLKNGITYKFSTSDTGSPFSGYNVAVKVAKVASTSGIQIAFKVVSVANTELDLLAIRPCLGGNYGAWRKYSGVIPT